MSEKIHPFPIMSQSLRGWMLRAFYEFIRIGNAEFFVATGGLIDDFTS
jgi:hypothetical protein